MSSQSLTGVGTDCPKDNNLTHSADINEPKCPYCGKADMFWSAKDLRIGKREHFSGVQYHCYEKKAMD